MQDLKELTKIVENQLIVSKVDKRNITVIPRKEEHIKRMEELKKEVPYKEINNIRHRLNSHNMENILK